MDCRMRNYGQFPGVQHAALLEGACVVMKRVILVFLCCVMVVVQGCNSAELAATKERTVTTEPSVDQQLLARLKSLSPPEAVKVQDRWGITGLAVYCAGAETVLACQWGQGYNAMQEGRALFWWTDGSWRSQPYPPEAVIGVGDFHGLRREGDLLQVIMNVSPGQTHLIDQVALLQYVAGKWQPAWGPVTSSPSAQLSLVFQPPVGIARYTLFRDEGEAYVHVREDWERQGSKYVRSGRAELSQAEDTVVRFVLAMMDKSDPNFDLTYYGEPPAVESAQRMDLAAALRPGFTTQLGTDGVVRLEAADRVKSWRLTVTQVNQLWKVATIQ
jgi:hypothetical protein